jgi:hypothetical protein
VLKKLVPKLSFASPILKAAFRSWRQITTGFLLGSAVGLSCAGFEQAASRFIWIAAGFVNKYFGENTTWPERGTETILIIAVAAAALYGIRLFSFLRRFWKSWRAGLMSGLSAIWFTSSAIAFALFNLTGLHRYLLILLFGIAGTLCVLRWNTKPKQHAIQAAKRCLDAPISKISDDILSRGAVVDSIVRSVVRDQILIVALTGAYGDGKSSVLNLVSNKLEEHDDIAVVPFSAWLPKDEEALVSSILNSVIEKLQTRLFIPKVRTVLIEFTSVLVSALPGVPSSLKDFFKKPSQSDQISELKRNLSKLPVRVVVLLDDIDRLHRKELEVLLKLLRGVQEFPKFSFVCAFHHDALVSILRSDSATKSRRRAEEFLEKFFPLQIPLPKIEPTLLAVEFEKKFYEICDCNNMLMIPEERQAFKDAFRIIWQTCIRNYLTNLRRLNLFANRLEQSLPLIVEEVNIFDFVILELIRMINPLIYEQIFRDAGYFMFARWRTTEWLNIIDMDEEQELKKRNAYFDELSEGLPAPSRQVVFILMREIFPTVKLHLDKTFTSQINPDGEKAQRERRIFHPDFFARYFILQVPQDLFGEKEISQFVSILNNCADENQCIDIFKAKYRELESLPMKRVDFLRRVDFSMQSFKPVATLSLAFAIAELSNIVEDESHALDETVAREIIFTAASRQTGIKEVQKILEEVIRRATSDRFATVVLNDCSGKETFAQQVAGIIHKDKLEQTFRERMSSRYGSGGTVSFFPSDGQADLVPLGRWALCGKEGAKQVRTYLFEEFSKRHSNIGSFLARIFPPRQIDILQEPWRKGSLETVKIYFPPEELLKLINEYGDSSCSSPAEAEAIEEFKSHMKDRS